MGGGKEDGSEAWGGGGKNEKYPIPGSAEHMAWLLEEGKDFFCWSLYSQVRPICRKKIRPRRERVVKKIVKKICK